MNSKLACWYKVEVRYCTECRGVKLLEQSLKILIKVLKKRIQELKNVDATQLVFCQAEEQ